MTADRYEPGDRVRILKCPVKGQHDGQEAVVIDTYMRVLRVELPSGERCWPYRVEPLPRA